MHWRARHREKSAWLVQVKAECCRGYWPKVKSGKLYKLARDARRLRKVRLGLVVRCRRDQDEDNLNGSLKPVIDALCRAGWLVDDNREWVEYEPRPTQGRLEGGEPRVEITWETINDKANC